MAITINWLTKVINVPKTYTTLVQSLPTEIRQLDVNVFRLDLKDIEDSEEGMPFLDTHRHSPEVQIAGLSLARVVEIINGYTITFEDDQYTVNLIGANTNLAEVTNVNQVSIRSSNSAGLTTPGFTPAERIKLEELWRIHGLDNTKPLEVSSTERKAGTEIVQTISTGTPPFPGEDPPVTVTRNT